MIDNGWNMYMRNVIFTHYLYTTKNKNALTQKYINTWKTWYIHISVIHDNNRIMDRLVVIS